MCCTLWVVPLPINLLLGNSIPAWLLEFPHHSFSLTLDASYALLFVIAEDQRVENNDDSKMKEPKYSTVT